MAVVISKANQRQMQKSKSRSKHIKKKRMKVIPFVCPKCGKDYELSSAQAYRDGGNFCTNHIEAKLQFNPKRFHLY